MKVDSNSDFYNQHLAHTILLLISEIPAMYSVWADLAGWPYALLSSFTMLEYALSYTFGNNYSHK